MHGLLFRVAYAVQKKLWRLLRPRTRGVKVMLFDRAGQLLLIRNSYGNRGLWLLPGGGIRSWETPERAAIREVREELGCEIADVRSAGEFASSAEGKRDTVHLFEARCIGEPKADAGEVAEAGFFAPDALPEDVSPATQRRIAERLGRRVADGQW
jgi:ADP-ribose pyrophosphatase YjhB (NUDIX family)